MSLSRLVRDLAAGAGIPRRHISAVVARAAAAVHAVVEVEGFQPLGGGLVVLAHRVVGGALADHERGVLERRCA